MLIDLFCLVSLDRKTQNILYNFTIEPHHEKTCFLNMPKQKCILALPLFSLH